MRAMRVHFLLLGGILVWVCVQAYPELRIDRIDPYDGALFAANGAIFLSALQDIGQLLASPMDWLYGYYNQYPALAVRRHPPLFGISETLVYLITGVSVLGAKVTGLLYAVVLAAGVYALSFRIWRDAALAGATALLVMSTPQVVWLGTAVRLDVPALALAVWALYHYVEYLRTGRRSSAVWFAVLSVLSLYTYQLTFFIVGSACLHLILLRRLSLLSDRTVWIAAAVMAAFLIPLGIEQAYVAGDNITAAAGGEVEDWKRFHPIADRLSLDFVLYYPLVWLNAYPVQTAGLAIWAVLAMRRGVTREDALLLLCAGTAFAFFSWMRGKDPRYAIYTMIPIAFLAARAIQDLIRRPAPGGGGQRTVLASGFVAAVALGQSFAVPTPAFHLSGMEAPVRDILARITEPRILYSGPRDGAFVFYVRQLDSERTARIHRTTVQLTDPGRTAQYVDEKRINAIAFEHGDSRLAKDRFSEFAAAISRLADEGAAFESVGTYPLRLTNAGKEKEIQLTIYRRKSP